MILQVAVCSQCKARKDINTVGPEGWYQLRIRSVSDGEFFLDFDFCSNECLLGYIQYQIKQKKESDKRNQIFTKAYEKSNRGVKQI